MSRTSAGFRFSFKYDGDRLPGHVPDWILAPQDLAQVDFDLKRLATGGIFGRLRQAATGWAIRLSLRLLQRFWPRCRIGNLLVLTRHADVDCALWKPEVFATHYEPEMRLLAYHYRPGNEMSEGHATFMLGIDDKKAHGRQRAAVETALGSTELIEDYRNTTELVCKALLANGGGRIDVMKDYFTRVSAEAAIRLLGLEIDDPDSFADWTLAMSTMVFGDPFGKPVVRELAQHAAWRMRAAADRAIEIAQNRKLSNRKHPEWKPRESLVTLLSRPTDPPGLDKAEIRAVLIGTAIGLVPTVTLAAGNIMQWLLKHPKVMKKACRHAKEGEVEALGEILEEVARLTPALNPGQFRYVDCASSVSLPSGDLSIPAGTIVLAATAQALRDRRVFPEPNAFRLNRGAARPSLMFGAGMHTCLGWRLAIGQITTMFRWLLAEEGLRPVKGKAGRLETVGPFPRRQDFRYAAQGQGRDVAQSMATIVIPLDGLDPCALEEVKRKVDGLDNPAKGSIRETLDRTGTVHFCSLSLLDVGGPGDSDFRLIFEINCDGEEAEAIERIARTEPRPLVEIFRLAGFRSGDESLGDFLRRHRLEVRPRPWGTTGLLYNGSAGFSVAAKRKQCELARFAAAGVDYHLRRVAPYGGRQLGDIRPIRMMRFIRDLMMEEVATVETRILRNEYAGGVRPFEDTELKELQKWGSSLRPLLFVPSRDEAGFASWRPDWLGSKILRYLSSASTSGVAAAALIALAAITGLVWLGLANADSAAWRTALVARLLLGLAAAAILAAAVLRHYRGEPSPVRSRASAAGAAALAALALIAFLPGAAALAAGPATFLGAFAAVILLAILASLSVFGLVAFSAFLWLRRLEEKDRPDDRDPDLALRREIAKRENAPKYEQNHILSCSDFKPGVLRRLTFALAMWGIGLFCRYWTRPGFILSMGTIHFARWLRLPGADKLIFLSNYDGSWESYLEDFITKAHPGQTAAWSHGEGFPRTRGLTGEGARDGDRFKRWVRRQQRVTHFWYSRFPELTLERVRINAMIHEGLARAATDTQAREWLALFGSLQRPEATIESHEVQALLFRGLPTRPWGVYMFVDLGGSSKETCESLGAFIGESTEDCGFEIPTVTFGDLQAGTRIDDDSFVLAIGLTRSGLDKLCLPGEKEADGLASFPLPFLDGMQERSRILGDLPEPRWTDRQCDAVLILLGPRRPSDDRRTELGEAPAPDPQELLRRKVKEIDEFLNEKSGGGLIGEPVYTQQIVHKGKPSPMHDHFHFRDGISQPAIRGTSMARKAAANDLVEPGEFILGYPSNQGYIAPSLRIRVDLDPADYLPDTSTGSDGRYPSFRHGEGRATPFRDLGRNGSYLVIRQIVQCYDNFNKFAEETACHIRKKNYRGIEEALQQKIDASWVKAKIVGRWRNGTLLSDSRGPSDRSKSDPRNDFSFATEDPRGLGCPLGAHIRRANPRDSLDWDDPRALAIANRHRLLRRGRYYEEEKNGKVETGLMFTAFCADIERQFEFVMQHWLHGRRFHGLDGETDPLTTSGMFTIPTVVGPLRIEVRNDWVTTVGGGYFFLPSRAALRYLADASRLSLPATLARIAEKEKED